jgi:hypothetical protein
MRRILNELLSAVIAFIVLMVFMLGLITIIRSFTDSQIIEMISIVSTMFLIVFVSSRSIKKINKTHEEMYNLTMDQAHIRNVLFDWSRGNATTRSALQQIDQIYNHVYTDSIKIKDSDI